MQVAADPPAPEAPRPAAPVVIVPVRVTGGTDAQPYFGPDLVSQRAAAATTDPGRPTDRAALPPSVVALGTTLTVAATGVPLRVAPAETTEPTHPRHPDGAPIPVPESPAVVDAATPIDVDTPRAAPLAGLLGLDVGAIEDQARQLLARVSDLVGVPDELGGTEGLWWMLSAAVLTGGAGYAVWANRHRARPNRFTAGPDSVLVRWGEEHDSRVR